MDDKPIFTWKPEDITDFLQNLEFQIPWGHLYADGGNRFREVCSGVLDCLEARHSKMNKHLSKH